MIEGPSIYDNKRRGNNYRKYLRETVTRKASLNIAYIKCVLEWVRQRHALLG